MAIMSDEAFALLLLETIGRTGPQKIWQNTEWNHLLMKQQTRKRKAIYSKYTSGAWGSKMYRGWSKEGLK